MAGLDRSSPSTRQSAPWGSGNRGERSSGGRAAAALLVSAFALGAPLAASAGSGGPPAVSLVPQAAKVSGPKAGVQGTFVPPALLKQAQENGNQKLRVIIQASGGAGSAASAFAATGQKDGGTVSRRLGLVNGVAVELKAKWIIRLAKIPGLIVTADAPVKTTGRRFNAQLWPYVTGNATLWGTAQNPAPNAGTIAIVDSGLAGGRQEFDGHTYPQVNLSSLTPNAQGDGDGHGTFVAGIAAGGLEHYTGASPSSEILPIRVMDDEGVARTSDVIAAAQWILANKDAYNIKVANFSLHSSIATHFFFDPLDRAVEKLWFNGIVVVAAAGNYGTGNTPSGVLYSPGNDPFVITVGAVDIGGSVGKQDDSVAPWSAWGHTEDGFAKPELGAPGRYMIGPVSNGTLRQQRGDHVVSPDYMQLSGTSFAAPVVAGAAAQLLALHPDWTPDQVKGALMLAAEPAPGITNWQIGVGEVDAAGAAALVSPPNPNLALDAFVAPGTTGGLVFDAPGFVAAVTSDPSWGDAAWTDAAWTDAAWTDAAWTDAAWTDAAWTDAAWTDAAWTDAAWTDAAWADAAWADAAESEPVGPVPLLDAAALADLQATPGLALPPGSDTIAALGLTSDSSTSGGAVAVPPGA